jgi:PAS domain S-box-containing protein
MLESSAKKLQKKPVSSKPESLIRVLHVDDDDDFLRCSKPFLEMQDSFQVETALSVKEALQKIRQKQYDVIVSDYIMPGKDGLEFLKELRESGNNIPFIIFTGKDREIVAIKALNFGADQYINKIGKTETVYSELAHSIRTVVKGKKAEEEVVRLSIAVKMSTDGIMITDLNGKLLDANKATLKRYGTDNKKDLIGKSAIDFVVPEDREKVLVGVKEAFEKGYCKRLECYVVIKDGSKIPVEMSLTIIKAQDGKPIGFVSVTRDITERKIMERALQESEKRFRELSELLPEVIFEMDLKKELKFVNHAAYIRFGYSKEEFDRGLNALQMLVPEDRKRAEENIARVLRGENIGSNEYTALRKDGTTFPILINSNSIIRGDRAVGLRGIMVDITEHKKAVEKLKENERKYRLLTENTTDIIYIQDMNLNVTYVSPSIEKMAGYTPEELLKLRPKDFMTPESFERGLADFKEATTSATENPNYEIPIKRYEYVCKDGSTCWGELKMKLLRDSNNNLVGVQGTLRDITDRKKVEEALRDSEKRFRAIINSAQNPMILVGEKGEIAYWNAAAEKTFGYTKKEATGKELHKLLAPERFYEDYRKGFRKFMKTGQGAVVGKSLEVTAIKKDGTEILIELSLSALKLEGKWCAIGIVRDITERKEAEKKLDRMMNELVTINEKLGVIGRLTRHDARNKLSIIANNVYLAKQKLPANHNSLGYLGDVESAIDQMEEIFSFARNYEMLGVEEVKYMDVGKSVEEAAILLSGLAEIKLVNECKGLTVMADSLLRQLFYNLIDDTLKYGEKVSQIRVQYEEGEDQLKLVYEDDGVGIPEEEKEKIFREGYGKGTGYGLYLIKKICEAYGWTIRETGKQGKGAQFTMTIPKTNKNGRPFYLFDGN